MALISRYRCALSVILAFPAAILGCVDARSADWNYVPSVDLQGSYNDNVRLTTAPHDTVWGSFITPALKLDGATKLWRVDGGAALRINRYSGDNRLDSNDYLFDLDAGRDTPWGQWNLDSAYHLDTTLQSELLDTGLVQVRKRRTERRLSPSWTGTVTRNSGLQLQYSYRDVSYADATNTGLFDYRDQGVSAGVFHDVGKNSRATLSASFSRYEVNEIRFTSDYSALSASLASEFGNGLQSGLTAGIRSVDTQQRIVVGPQLVTFNDSANGFVLEIDLKQQRAAGLWHTNVSRAVNPTGGGYLVQTDRATFWWSWDWTRNLRPTLEVAVYRNKGLGINPGNVDRNYFRAAPRLIWFLSPTWSIHTIYRYERQEYDNAVTAADRNRFDVVVRYQAELPGGHG